MCLLALSYIQVSEAASPSTHAIDARQEQVRIRVSRLFPRFLVHTLWDFLLVCWNSSSGGGLCMQPGLNGVGHQRYGGVLRCGGGCQLHSLTSCVSLILNITKCILFLMRQVDVWCPSCEWKINLRLSKLSTVAPLLVYRFTDFAQPYTVYYVDT